MVHVILITEDQMEILWNFFSGIKNPEEIPLNKFLQMWDNENYF